MCRLTFDDNVRSLWELHENRKYGCTEHVFLKVQTSIDDSTLYEINLMDTVGKRKAVKRPQTNDNDNYWLPFHENTVKFRDETLIPYFVQPCLAAGFNLIAKGWEEKHQFIHFVCNRSRAAKSKEKDLAMEQDPSSKKTKPVRRTCRPIWGENGHLQVQLQSLVE